MQRVDMNKYVSTH